MRSCFALLTIGAITSATMFGCTDEVDEVVEGEATTGEVRTLTGEVVEVLDGRTFTMKDEHEWIEGDLLTVVSNTDLPPDFNDEDEVTVTGTVQNVGYIEVESGYDWDFDPEVEAELEDVRGFLIADSVSVTEHEEAD
ncbi:hypothetical protein Mal4_49130 [Maioricimonas rarisocia]|uniref:Bacterial OB-fold domain-containing protein n=1 Tax=Maioricimonas rarisocia TaxID=2528026 RepID=A0A517ZDK8_9PLAN|nr:hypothetical protein [Maioricimonas rarisocia]QDU40555.1 hypothetical protein Mal4_49130 [Maioricimonas rarisocia]